MKLFHCLAMSALILGAPALSSDLNLLNGAAHAAGKGKGAEMSGGANSKGAEKSASAGSKSSEMSDGKRSVNADLKGVNSLNRSLNGLMNSKDPKMDGFRAFVVASAEYEIALDVLETAVQDFLPNRDAYQLLLDPLSTDDMPLTVPTTDAGWTALYMALTDIKDEPAPTETDYTTGTGEEGDPIIFDEITYLADLSAWQDRQDDADSAIAGYAAIKAEWDIVAAAQADVDAKEPAASEDAMVDAIVAALNATGAGPVTSDDISDEMADWVAERLGKGDDLDGLIDEYLASL